MADTEAKKFINALWADAAPSNRQSPEDAGIDRNFGWDVNYEQPGTGKYPERRVWNQMIRELQGAFREKIVFGLPRWAEDVNWRQDDFVTHNLKIWYATLDHGPDHTTKGQEPGTGAAWREY